MLWLCGPGVGQGTMHPSSDKRLALFIRRAPWGLLAICYLCTYLTKRKVPTYLGSEQQNYETTITITQ